MMSKLHPLLKSKWEALGDNVHRELFDQAMRMSVPFWWHGPTADDPEIYNNGSLSLLDTGERILGVTAWHVYSAYLARLASSRPFVAQFGGVTVFPERMLIDHDERLDLATFDIQSVLPQLGGFVAHRPRFWPPSRPTIQDLVIYGGFPGQDRRHDLVRATFRLDTVTGLVSQVTSTNVVIEVDYDRLFDADGPEGSVVSANPAGTSGGPIYRIIEGPDLQITGIICEQSPSNRFLLARHADAIRSDGTIAAM